MAMAIIITRDIIKTVSVSVLFCAFTNACVCVLIPDGKKDMQGFKAAHRSNPSKFQGNT